MRGLIPLLVVLSCSTPSSPPPVIPSMPARAQPVDGPARVHSLLDAEPVLTGAECADDPVPATLAPGPFRYAGETRAGMHHWITDLPYRPRGMFFQDPEEGLSLTLDDAPVPFDRFGIHDTPRWSHDHRSLHVYTPGREAPSTLGRWALAWPAAVQRESRLRQGASAGLAAALRSVRVGDDTLTGVLLGCSGSLGARFRVPPGGELSLSPGIVPPEVDTGPRSDGADLVISVGGDTLATLPLQVGRFDRVHLDLSHLAGQDVALELHVLGGATDSADHVFVADPVVHTRQSDPPRVVMVFVDTLRADRLTQSGYDRDTTAPLDTLARSSAWFTQARSVAPWTLPSARTALTGMAPEQWDDADTLAEVFGGEGWATAFLAGNLYLSAQLGLDRGFALHRAALWPSAEQVTDEALAWLDAHDGRPAFLQVHYMDPHLPYLEPPAYRTRYASPEVPRGLREQFHVSDVRRAGPDLDDAAKAWIGDRYDNNVRYTAEHVARLVDALDDDDIVVFYSDHGEEFFEHEAFEHGHSLFDELLRVPLMVRAPGMPAGAVDVPVSLLDLAPTLLDLTGHAHEHLDGISLRPVAQGAPGAEEALRDRMLAVGRPRYGTPRWGLLDGDHKWVTGDGRELLFDVAVDPAETASLLLEEPDLGHVYRSKLPVALGRDVVTGWRWEVSRSKPGPNPPHEALCTVPGGWESIVVAEDPLGKHTAEARRVADDEAQRLLTEWDAPSHRIEAGSETVWMSFTGHGPEVVAAPNRPMAEVGHEAQCTARWCVRHARSQRDCPTGTTSISPSREAHFGDTARTPLARLLWGRGRQFLWGLGVAPQLGDAALLHPEELRDALEAIGYTEPDQETTP